jgi:DNA-binding MarR family transcriptional regulator
MGIEALPAAKSAVRRERESAEGDALLLRAAVQRFAHSFGLLITKQTPCGHPVSPSYAHCLLVLLEREDSGEETSQADLCTRLTIDKSNVARLCSKLQSAGHAMQWADPEDGRGRIVRLTQKGRQLAMRLDASSRERFERVLSAIAISKRPAVMNALTTLIGAVQALDHGEIG